MKAVDHSKLVIGPGKTFIALQAVEKEPLYLSKFIRQTDLLSNRVKNDFRR